MNRLLSVECISKSYGGSLAVDNISFEVLEGEILGLVGPNGAGKSTIIRAILGIKEPDAGAIQFSFDSTKRINTSKIGYLPEERGLYKDVKIVDILTYLAELKDYPKEKAYKRALEYLERFELKDRATAKIKELSKGMAQKVQFIASIIHEPKFLVLDEPLSGLDPVSQDLFIKEIKTLSEKGTTILLSSHQMDMVESMCNRIFMINKGKQVLYGEIEKIKEQFGNFKCEIYGSNFSVDFYSIPYVERVEKDGNKSIIHLKRDIDPARFLKEIPQNTEIKEIHISRIALHDIFVSIIKGGVDQ
jgi:ABC-2 type transport system ATP-binding protein